VSPRLGVAGLRRPASSESTNGSKHIVIYGSADSIASLDGSRKSTNLGEHPKPATRDHLKTGHS
jgi:hypothetical protein